MYMQKNVYAFKKLNIYYKNYTLKVYLSLQGHRATTLFSAVLIFKMDILIFKVFFSDLIGNFLTIQ